LGGGHDAWKVGGKMFAYIGAVMPGVSVKTDSIETAEMLIEAGVGVKAPYLYRGQPSLGTREDELLLAELFNCSGRPANRTRARNAAL
jgi:hypothetical protein